MVQSLAAMLMATVVASQESVDDTGLLQRSSVKVYDHHPPSKGKKGQHSSNCSRSHNICEDVEQSSDKCLRNRPNWYPTGPDHDPPRHVHGRYRRDIHCADNVQFCSNAYWGRDMLDCCPSTCSGQISITQSPAGTMAHIELNGTAVQVYRASILHFLSNPWEKEAREGTDLATVEEETYEFFEDGYLMVEEGKVKGRGNWADLSAEDQEGAYEYPERLIVPGFVDTHIHAPQTEIIAAFGASLIPWLEKYTFPAESKYSDTIHAKTRAEVFVKELLRAGTTTALAFSTRHKDAANALFETFNEYNMLHISGKVLMDDPGNAPESLRDESAESSIEETRELIEEWHGVGRNLYAITPRFAPTSTLKQMNLTGELMKQFPDVYMHTHLSESMGEIGWVNWQFGGKYGADPDREIGENSANPYGATDHEGNPGKLDGYLSVYDHFGMLGPKSIFAHSIHLSQKEWQRLGDTGSTVSFCPTSNNFLGSGLFNAAQAVEHEVRFGMGTDVGAGTSFSMLRTMGDGYKALKLGESWLLNVDPFLDNATKWDKYTNQSTKMCSQAANWPECGLKSNDVVLSAAKAFYTATMGGAKQLSLDHRIGNFEDDKEADFVVLNFGGGREFVADRMADAFLNAKDEPKAKLMEKLFVLMMMGDDRHVEATYVYGSRVYSQ